MIRLCLPSTLRVLPTFHLSRIKPVQSSPFFLAARTPPSPPSPHIIHSPSLPVPPGHGVQYLVDWEGYGLEERHWVPAWDILDPSHIQDFWQGLPAPESGGYCHISGFSPFLSLVGVSVVFRCVSVFSALFVSLSLPKLFSFVPC